MKRLVVFLMVLGLVIGVSGLAQADFSWQTEPILGYSHSDVTGDVVVVTGPTPINPATGFPYLDVDGNTVLGPTIPHYSIAGDPLYGVGSPSVSTFYYNPNFWDVTTSAWIDPLVGVYSGSGINLDPDATYAYTGVYSFFGSSVAAPYSLTVASDTASGTGSGGEGFVGSDFIMLMTGVNKFWPEDAGHWSYTETWTDETTLVSIDSSREFDLVQRVPEPATMLLLGLGLMGIAGIRRKFKG